jgi:hypothetical protein
MKEFTAAAGRGGAGQQTFGDSLLGKHKLILIPSVVSAHSWKLVFDRTAAAGTYVRRLQEAVALDTRLHPPGKA